MKFEKFNSQPKKDQAPDPERRKFLKRSAQIIGGAFGSFYGLDKALDYYLKDEKKVVEKNHEEPVKTEKTENMKEHKEEEIKTPEKSEAKKIADEILRVYNTPEIARRFDPKVFTKDFFMAQQYQESRFKADAESVSGAKGVYQVKTPAVIDVVKFLARLNKKEKCGYNGPSSITGKQAEEISDMFAKNSDYGRSIGKLYLLAIYDPDYAYNRPPNKDVFRGRSVDEQQNLLLVSYHDGPSARYRPDKASPNAKEYVSSVRNFMTVIDDIRDKLEKNGLSRDMDYAIVKIMREMERKENRQDPDGTIDKWVEELLEAQRSKGGEPLSNNEVREIFGN